MLSRPLWPFRNYRGVARARPLFKSMIFGRCATISSIQDTNHPRQPRPPGNSTRGGGLLVPSANNHFPQPPRSGFTISCSISSDSPTSSIFPTKARWRQNFLNFSTLPVGFGLAITPVFLVDAIRFHEWNDCHAAWRDIDVTPTPVLGIRWKFPTPRTKRSL